jgi:hypothetical protein
MCGKAGFWARRCSVAASGSLGWLSELAPLWGRRSTNGDVWASDRAGTLRWRTSVRRPPLMDGEIQLITDAREEFVSDVSDMGRSGSRMADDEVQFELKTVQAVRGTEARSIAKWQNDGWEYVDQNQGKLRTTLNFRRVKPKTFNDYFMDSVAAFRRLQPKAQLALAASAALILVAGSIGIVVGTQGEGDSSQPSAASVAPSEEPSEEPEESQAGEAEEILTVENNEDLAALLAVSDDDLAEEFADKYEGRLIEFDGNIADMANHDDYDTRYDMLIYVGDYDETSAIGPSFKFEDVGIYNLHLTGSNSPNYVGQGDNLHVIARVEEFNSDTGLFFLEPVSTEVR